MNVIEINNVSKKFRKGEKFNSLRDAIPNFFKNLVGKSTKSTALEDREFWAVKDVNITIKEGEVVGLIGSNGAGKSTILKLLSRIMDPTKGEIQINGRLSALIEVTAGFHPELTGRENIYLNGTILGMKKKELDEKFDEIVAFSGLSEFIDTPVKRYSSGMYSRLGFSVAAHVNPDILLVDEVLAVGDIAFQAKCAQKMRELLQSGSTIVLVSHNLAMVRSLCQRIILLDHGQVIREGEPHEVIPYYENIIFQHKEAEFKKQLERGSDGKVAVNDASPITIDSVEMVGGGEENKDSFLPDDPLKFVLKYNPREPVESPIFSIDIKRSDGVHCVSHHSRLKEVGQGKEAEFTVSQPGEVVIDLGVPVLTPGLYILEFGIWDKEVLHPYCIRKEDVFKVVAGEGDRGHNPGVFLPAIKWTLNT